MGVLNSLSVLAIFDNTINVYIFNFFVCVYRILVKTQAETMVNTAQDKYNECLKTAESKIPSTTPFIENLSKCVKSLREDGEIVEVDEVIVEESEIANDVN